MYTTTARRPSLRGAAQADFAEKPNDVAPSSVKQCRRYAYIGLCYGPPGVGKTLSARSYSRWDKVKQSDRWGSGPTEDPLLDTVFYTPSVVNAPNTIQADIRHCRDTLRDLAKRPLRQEKEGELDVIRRRDAEHQAKILLEYDWFSGPVP